MTKTEMDIRSVLGPAGGSIRPLAAASDLFARRMFEERMDSEDIFLTKDIYPIVAVWLQKKPGATGRAIERLAARCWDLGDRGRLSEIAGKNLREPPAPRDIMIYFAWYSHKGIPYFEAMKGKQPFFFEGGVCIREKVGEFPLKSCQKRSAE